MGETSVKELSQKSGIVYSTLLPVIKGERDFGISKLLRIAEALGVSIEDILAGTYTPKTPRNAPYKTKIKYLAVFITSNKATRCFLQSLSGDVRKSAIFPFHIYCYEDSYAIIDSIKRNLGQLLKNEDINYQEVAVYAASIGCEYTHGVARLQQEGNKQFNRFIIEPDWKTSHQALYPSQSGILITINDGFVVSYSLDQGQTIQKLQGYSFDDAGMVWLGHQAIKHAIAVAEGMEERTLLSDGILSTYNSDLNLLASSLFDNPRDTCLEVFAIMISLLHRKGKSSELIEQSFKNIWRYVEKVDSLSGKPLPIKLAGELAHVYDAFVPAKRFKGVQFHNEDAEYQYGIQQIKKSIESD